MASHRIESFVRRAIDTATVEEVDGDRQVRFDPHDLAQLTKELRSGDSLGEATAAAQAAISHILSEADLDRANADAVYKREVLDRALAGVELRDVLERQPTRRRFVEGPDGLRAVDD